MKLAIIGVGLIGGSFALALRAANAVTEVIGCGRNIENLQTAQDLGIIDSYTQNIQTACKDADVIFVAVPVSQMAACFAEIRPILRPEMLLTDGGSTKQSVIAAARSVWQDGLPPNFVAGHPIAGTEKSGASAAFATLFQNKKVILTPTVESCPDKVTLLSNLWAKCGAKIDIMSAQHHDQVLALTSHLPHIVAYSLVDTAYAVHQEQEVFAYAAGGFRDTTRIAGSSPNMWLDIVRANHQAILPLLNLFEQRIHMVREALESPNHVELQTVLEELFSQANYARTTFFK